jgi:hypothetical protein
MSASTRRLLQIGGSRAVTPTDATKMEFALRALPLWRGRSTLTEWMGVPSPGRKKYPIAKGKG